MKKNKTVLVCPLDWGLGHCTRCIPIITELLNQNAEVLIAGDGDGIALLKKEFPQLKFIFLKGYRAKYNAGNLAFSMIKQLPRFFSSILREHLQLKKIISDNKIDVVISDNRYGLWHKKIKSIFISHQLNIQTPEGLNFVNPLINSLNRFFISQFSECWIPDVQGNNNLSGKLSEQSQIKIPVYRIGILSRFANEHFFTPNTKRETVHHIVCILSGPEPQRTIFEGMLLEQLEKINKSVLIIRGRPNDKQELKSKFLIEFKNHATANEMVDFIKDAGLIIARSGYSTIMDLAVLGKKAILIPTPGQTEQEYLAAYFYEKKIYFSQTQTELDLHTALNELTNFSGIKIDFDKSVLCGLIKRVVGV